MKAKLSLSLILAVIISLVIASCRKNQPSSDDSENLSDTPVLSTQPDNYALSSNDNLATLGRVLFYDRNLSMNNSISCASCHQQSKAFCDNLRFSPGVENAKTPRNSPSIFGKEGRVFWDGRASSMLDLTLRPVRNHVEMRFENMTALAEKMSKISYYPELFRKAFNTSTIDSTKIQRALAEFLRNFNFSDNKFSRSERNIERLSASEELGRMVFFGKGRCSNCHHVEGNRNVPFPGDTMGSPGGGYGFTDEAHNIGLDEMYADNGIGKISNRSSENGMFMIPALLNVEYTAPYMHDGRFKTLEEVIDHYDHGIKNHKNLDIMLRNINLEMSDAEADLLIAQLDKNHDGDVDESELAALPPVKLGLTNAEKRGLVDFLKTLSDPKIFSEKKFSNPFAVQ